MEEEAKEGRLFISQQHKKEKEMRPSANHRSGGGDEIPWSAIFYSLYSHSMTNPDCSVEGEEALEKGIIGLRKRGCFADNHGRSRKSFQLVFKEGDFKEGRILVTRVERRLEAG